MCESSKNIFTVISVLFPGRLHTLLETSFDCLVHVTESYLCGGCGRIYIFSLVGAGGVVRSQPQNQPAICDIHILLNCVCRCLSLLFHVKGDTPAIWLIVCVLSREFRYLLSEALSWNLPSRVILLTHPVVVLCETVNQLIWMNWKDKIEFS